MGGSPPRVIAAHPVARALSDPNAHLQKKSPLIFPVGERQIVVMTTIGFDPEIGKATRFKKGQPSPNPGGRPKSRLLSEALRVRLAEHKPNDPEGRTYAEIIAANLIAIASSAGAGAVTAANEICDRSEGKPSQRIELNNITAQLREKSNEDLQYHLDHGCWPEDELLEGAQPTD